MAAVALFWNINMAAVTSCENALLQSRNYYLLLYLVSSKLYDYIPYPYMSYKRCKFSTVLPRQTFKCIPLFLCFSEHLTMGALWHLLMQ